MRKVEHGHVIEVALNAAALHQYGNNTNVPIWWAEDTPHGVSYRGFNYATNRWLQVDLDFKLGDGNDNSQASQA